MCDAVTAWLKKCSGGSHEDAVREVSRLATLYGSYVVRAEVEISDLTPIARKHLNDVRLLNTPAAKAAARTTALRIREITAEKAKYESLALKCSAEARKLRDFQEFNTTVAALGQLNRLLRRTDASSIMKNAENAVADSEGATAAIDGIGNLLGSQNSVDIDEDELMRELELIAGTAHVQAPEQCAVETVTVVGVPTFARPVSQGEYMKKLLEHSH